MKNLLSIILSLTLAAMLSTCTPQEPTTHAPTGDTLAHTSQDSIGPQHTTQDTPTTKTHNDTITKDTLTQSNQTARPRAIRDKYRRHREKEDKARPPIHRQGDPYIDPLTPSERAFIGSLHQQKRKGGS